MRTDDPSSELIFKSDEPATETMDIISVHLDNKLLGLLILVVKTDHRLEQIDPDAVRCGRFTDQVAFVQHDDEGAEEIDEVGLWQFGVG